MAIDLKALFDAEPGSPLYVAINRVLVRNDPGLMRMMKEASAKMCLATALTPGFRGFDLLAQTGTCPMGMRWAASSDMRAELSHVWIDQFTYWESWQAHEDFHETFEDVVVDSCAKCGGMLLDGVAAHILCETQAAHAAGDHTIFVGLVTGGACFPRRPLLHFRGAYHRLP